MLDGKNLYLGSGIRNKHPGSDFRELSNNLLGEKYLNSLLRIRILDPVPVCPGIRDPGWKKSDLGSRKNVPDPNTSSIPINWSKKHRIPDQHQD
jgi:hypothetical protein